MAKRPADDDDIPSTSQLPPAKKQRKQKAAPQEKRTARFRASCPKNILDRLDRVISQRYLTSRVIRVLS